MDFNFDQLRQLQTEIANLGELTRTFAAAVPRQAEGSDPTGWVRVVLGPDGLPTDMSVRNGWNQRIEAERLGAAVVEANIAAINAAMEAWSGALDDSRWWAQSASFDEDGASRAVVSPPEPPVGRSRDLPDLTEEVLAAINSAEQQEPVDPVAVDGADPERRVSVRLGPQGMAECSIDPGWASRVDGDRVTAALSQALESARRRLPAPQKFSNLDGLAGDALATLHALAQLPTGGTTGGTAER